MSFAQITLGEAASGGWKFLWKGVLWAVGMYMAAFALGMELSWRVVALCIISSFLDALIYSKAPALTSHVRQESE